ncbi:hypothetical protein [Streptacidiphilus monticola]|uniref:Uncharacterized protein n=1 Tax=Streptacidiphilus monticola TaxID=2161674 RepID=A0ABW1G6N8_9ACTN
MQTSDWIALGGLAVAVAAFIVPTVISLKAKRTAEEANGLSQSANATAERALRESIRSRIDSAAPTLSVSAGPVSWPPLRFNTADAFAPGQPWPPQQEFNTTADAGTLIGLRATLTIRNGGVGCEVTVNGDLERQPGQLAPQPLGETFWMGAGEVKEVVMEGYRPLEEWIAMTENSNDEDAGPNGPIAVTVGYRDNRDEGMTADISVRLPCTGLLQHPSKAGTWHFAPSLARGDGHDRAKVGVHPEERLYWASKRQNLRLEA